MLNNFIVELYKNSPFYIKKIITRVLARNVKSECESDVLRVIWHRHYGVKIGKYTYGCFNDCFPSGTVVGNYCSISKGVRVLNANHPISSTFLTPYFYNKIFGYDVADVERFSLTIGNDVWLGYGSIILSKCSQIGNGAIIGAGSVVTKDVPAYAIVVGNPARILRYRFTEDICKGIDATKWWECAPDELIKHKKYMNNPRLFIHKWRSL